MERFAPALRRVARELDLPRRIRTELLREMAADLEAVYEHHRTRGVEEGEAARRAEETVLGSSQVIRRLGRLHVSPWRAWADDVGERLSAGVHLLLLGVGVLPIAAVAAGVTARSIATDPTPGSWAILLLGLAMAAMATAESARSLGRRPFGRPGRSGHSGRSGRTGYSGRTGVPSLLVLAAMAPAAGLLALVLGIQRAATGIPGSTPEPGGAALSAALVAAAERDGATFLAGLLLGIAGLLAWFLIVEGEARRSAREVDALLADAAHGGAPAPTDDVLTLPRRRRG